MVKATAACLHRDFLAPKPVLETSQSRSRTIRFETLTCSVGLKFQTLARTSLRLTWRRGIGRRAVKLHVETPFPEGQDARKGQEKTQGQKGQEGPRQERQKGQKRQGRQEREERMNPAWHRTCCTCVAVASMEYGSNRKYEVIA